MARTRKLSDEDAVRLFAMVRSGKYSNEEVAKAFKIAKGTVKAYYDRVLRERMSCGSPRLVATRGVWQTLTFSVENGYVGSTTVGDARETVTIDAKTDEDAIVKYDSWLAGMAEEESAIGDGEVEELRARLAEYESGRWVPMADYDRLSDECAELSRRCDRLMADIHRLESEKVVTETVVPTNRDVVAIVATKPKVSVFGLFDDIDKAYEKVDELNAVGRALGIEDAFAVMEASWK